MLNIPPDSHVGRRVCLSVGLLAALVVVLQHVFSEVTSIVVVFVSHADLNPVEAYTEQIVDKTPVALSVSENRLVPDVAEDIVVPNVAETIVVLDAGEMTVVLEIDKVPAFLGDSLPVVAEFADLSVVGALVVAQIASVATDSQSLSNFVD